MCVCVCVCECVCVCVCVVCFDTDRVPKREGETFAGSCPFHGGCVEVCVCARGGWVSPGALCGVVYVPVVCRWWWVICPTGAWPSPQTHTHTHTHTLHRAMLPMERCPCDYNSQKRTYHSSQTHTQCGTLLRIIWLSYVQRSHSLCHRRCERASYTHTHTHKTRANAPTAHQAPAHTQSHTHTRTHTHTHTHTYNTYTRALARSAFSSSSLAHDRPTSNANATTPTPTPTTGYRTRWWHYEPKDTVPKDQSTHTTDH